MSSTFHEVYYDVERAIDYAFEGKFMLNFYQYLKVKDIKKVEIEQFITSNTVSNINNIITDLDEYLEGGADNQHKQLREAYGHIPKPQARKIRNYLNEILEDALRYNFDKRKGRRKKQTK
jgi:hypothetical protein